MSRSVRMTLSILLVLGLVGMARGDDKAAPPREAQEGAAGRVYGEWRIRVRPDQGPAYAKLIEQSGLPLFREAGGRMVGWWTTLVGDLYEQVTIWEYDDMAAFERAIQILSKNPAFARFVAARDPLLAGEESRFLRLAAGATSPALPEPAPFVIHEIHRVPLEHRDAYLDYMTRDGQRVLKDHGFKPAGPFVVDVGRWTEITYLFRFESLAQRERLMARFDHAAPARDYATKLGEFSREITTRLLVPAPFTRTAPQNDTPPKAEPAARTLPHREQLAPGVYAAGFSDRFHSANCGWVALADETLLIDLPRGIPAREFLALVAASTGKPARTLVLTHAEATDWTTVQALLNEGITQVLISPKTLDRLADAPGAVESAKLRSLAEPTPIGDVTVAIEFLPFDDVEHLSGGAAVQLPGRQVVFAGRLVFNGPRALLAGRDTALWMAALRRFEALAPSTVVPGFGSWGGPEILVRQRRFLAEIRRQIGYHVAQGRSVVDLRDQVHLPADCLVWMPYDTPRVEDFVHVYGELSIPQAPFNGRAPSASEPRPHALVLIGDQPHEPGHIEDGLLPAFEATGVVPHFAVDVRSLSAENLDKVRLLVILRDGLQRPQINDKGTYAWMTPEQERAVAAFVEKGGGFLNLHNAMGLYPDGGPYLTLVGGRYIGHGPLERFRVEVVDQSHPVTRGVSSFFTADEQHTPPCDEKLVHVLLRNRSDEGKTAAAGWVREVGRGRLCHLANGHTRESLIHPMYQRLLANAIRWCLRIEEKPKT